MFTGVGRRLAILNALVVIALIALVGAVSYAFLQQRLNAEVDQSLHARVEQVASQAPVSASPSSRSRERESDDDDEEHSRDDEEIVDSGDTIVFAVDRSGTVTFNPRNVALPGLPLRAGIDRALGGEEDTRSVSIAGVGRVRVMTIPIEHDHEVIGAAQAVRSLSEHEAELATVRWVTFLGAGIGALIAIPAGLFLARRAMRPINDAFARQRAFVADASHELRTPLTLIRATVELVQREPAAAAVQPELASILEEVDRTDRLVDDLLLLARADAGRLQLQRSEQDLAKVAAAAVESMQPLAKTGGVRLALTDGEPVPAWIDAERAGQVIRILLDNALKHSAPGGSVTVEVRRAGRDAVVAVRDTGTGIKPEDLPHVFDRFYRVDQARARATGGTGLGLAIAKALVGAHGGRIAISSKPGAGTTVTVNLPAAETG